MYYLERFLDSFVAWFVLGLVLASCTAVLLGWSGAQILTVVTALWALGGLWYGYRQYRAQRMEAPLDVYFDTPEGRTTHIGLDLSLAEGACITFRLGIRNVGHVWVSSPEVVVTFPEGWKVQLVGSPARHYMVATETDNMPRVWYKAVGLTLLPDVPTKLPTDVTLTVPPGTRPPDSNRFRIPVSAGCEDLEWRKDYLEIVVVTTITPGGALRQGADRIQTE